MSRCAKQATAYTIAQGVTASGSRFKLVSACETRHEKLARPATFAKADDQSKRPLAISASSTKLTT
jgi:hypothetical protein